MYSPLNSVSGDYFQFWLSDNLDKFKSMCRILIRGQYLHILNHSSLLVEGTHLASFGRNNG